MSYSKYIETNSLLIYSSHPLDIPAPRCICFYNGDKESEDITELRFSDLCKARSDIEIIVTMININYGRNKTLLEECKPLGEYSWFVAEVRSNHQLDMTIADAVDKAIKDMPDDYLIKPFLKANKAEVEIMCITEYDEVKYSNLVREEGRAEGRAEGIKEGKEEGSILTLWNLVKKGLLTEKVAAENSNMSLEEFRKGVALYCS